MNVLIAPDSFKDCLSARKVGESIRNGIVHTSGKWEIRIVPMADGGEGTVEALVDATNGHFVFANVLDPLMRPIRAKYGILGNGKTAVIEMAAASGIELLAPDERNPWITSSYGTGQLIFNALDKGCNRIIVGIGGSSTNDAGVGMAQTLGVDFRDSSGKIPGPGGGELSRIQHINTKGLDPRLKNCELIIACDVTNPLTGPEGASVVYGPQKGASKSMIKQLDRNLMHLAKLIRNQLNRTVDTVPGSGAAGGLGAGFLAFTDAVLRPGFEVVCKETRLPEYIQWADLIITGEGKIDFQTQFGKTPAGVARLAKQYGKPVIAMAGTLGEGYKDLYESGVDAIYSIVNRPMPFDEAIRTAPDLLEQLAESVIKTWKAAQKHDTKLSQ
jgi:glycerate kinase